jgi:hypothetical protein
LTRQEEEEEEEEEEVTRTAGKVGGGDSQKPNLVVTICNLKQIWRRRSENRCEGRA